MWTCKNCQSENEDNFDICWSCGSDKSGVKSNNTFQEDVFVKNKVEALRLADEKKEANLKDNKAIIITLAAILLAAFFMPWVKLFVSISAWDIIFGDVARYVDTPVKYLGLLIPVSAAIILYGSAMNDGNYPVVKGFLFSLSLITLVIFGIIIYNKISDGGGIFRPSGEDVVKVFNLGFWLTLGASILLCIIGLSANNAKDMDSSISTPAKEQLTVNESGYYEPAASLPSNQAAIIEQLERIQKMKNDGLLSEEEYQKMKNKIIASID